MRGLLFYLLLCLCGLSLILLLSGALLGVFFHTSFGPTPEAVRRIPELQNENIHPNGKR